MLRRPWAKRCNLESGEPFDGKLKSELVEEEWRCLVDGLVCGSGLSDCNMVSKKPVDNSSSPAVALAAGGRRSADGSRVPRRDLNLAAMGV